MSIMLYLGIEDMFSILSPSLQNVERPSHRHCDYTVVNQGTKMNEFVAWVENGVITATTSGF